MPCKFLLPDSLPGSSLDRFLAHGWYRMGPAVFTCDFLVQGETFGSTVWTRLPLAGWSPGRNLRRLIARNRRKFRVEVRRPLIDQQSEVVYQRYRKLKPWVTSPTLVHHLRAELDSDAFDTYEIAIYDGDRLAGFSHFDRGDLSVASILGVYDPDYTRYSLGLWSMLLEIEQAIALGGRFFYGGYVVPGYAPLDYKQRVGDLEFLDSSRDEWRPIAELRTEELPAEQVNARLAEVLRAADGYGLELASTLYPEYSLYAVDGFADLVPYPRFLRITNAGRPVLIAWDIERDAYVLASYRSPFVLGRELANAERAAGGGVELAEPDERLYEVTGYAEITQSVDKLLAIARAFVDGRPDWSHGRDLLIREGEVPRRWYAGPTRPS